ncbi:MAG: heavy-metal-associated domain-containing protein [Deltaproteobacteria bacterium]|nr:heavy-metal-associated domain-containing protein [Deltaproteobacteria bacterium]
MKRSLAGVEGVKEVDVSLKERKAWLTVDESVADEVLEKAVEESGFKGKVIRREPAAGS